jgi:hypothetical protein
MRVQIGRRGMDGVPDCSAADTIRARNPGFERVHVAGKRHIYMRLVCEVEDEDLVERVGGSSEIERRGLDRLAPASHAPAAVNHDAERDRRIVAEKDGDRLWLAVLEDSERILVQRRDRFALTVAHRDVHHHETSRRVETEWCLTRKGPHGKRPQQHRDNHELRPPRDKRVPALRHRRLAGAPPGPSCS